MRYYKLYASMRPRLLHLGYEFHETTRNNTEQASMRPRLLHLGYHGKHRLHDSAEGASMRPRLLHLGYGKWKLSYVGNHAGFNEAEAFTPRIYVMFAGIEADIKGLQ